MSALLWCRRIAITPTPTPTPTLSYIPTPTPTRLALVSEYGHHAQADSVDAVEQRTQVLGGARHERPDAWVRVRVRIRHGLRLDEFWRHPTPNSPHTRSTRGGILTLTALAAL